MVSPPCYQGLLTKQLQDSHSNLLDSDGRRWNSIDKDVLYHSVRLVFLFNAQKYHHPSSNQGTEGIPPKLVSSIEGVDRQSSGRLHNPCNRKRNSQSDQVLSTGSTSCCAGGIREEGTRTVRRSYRFSCCRYSKRDPFIDRYHPESTHDDHPASLPLESGTQRVSRIQVRREECPSAIYYCIHSHERSKVIRMR